MRWLFTDKSDNALWQSCDASICKIAPNSPNNWRRMWKCWSNLSCRHDGFLCRCRLPKKKAPNSLERSYRWRTVNFNQFADVYHSVNASYEWFIFRCQTHTHKQKRWLGRLQLSDTAQLCCYFISTIDHYGVKIWFVCWTKNAATKEREFRCCGGWRKKW